MSVIKEFKEFAIKGNVMDLAIGVIIGGAFGKIISSLVDDMLMPLIGTFIGSSFDKMTTEINGAEIKYGLFIQNVVNFIIIAWVVFLMVKSMNSMKKSAEAPTQEGPSSTDALLMEIRDALKK